MAAAAPALEPYGGAEAGARGPGAHYTPAALVDWIVERTVGEMGEGEVAILDPACGAGSFLIGAARRLLGGRRRPLAERRRIARGLYGVDVDAEAVARAREGIAAELGVAPGEVPVRVGDALAGPWPLGRERFDAVIGNPPFVRVRALATDPERVAFLKKRYRAAAGSFDLSLLFVERALELVREGGRIGLVLPIQALHQPTGAGLRARLLEETAVRAVVDLSRLKLFPGAAVKTCALVCEPGGGGRGSIEVAKPLAVSELGARGKSWPQREARGNPGASLKVDLLGPARRIGDKIAAASFRLDELCYVTFGVRSCAPGRGGGGKERLITRDGGEPGARPYLEGRDVARYAISPTGSFLRYRPEEMYSARRPELFEGRKIVSRAWLATARPVAALDEGGHFVEQSLLCVVPHGVVTARRAAEELPLEYVLAAMCSRVAAFQFVTRVIDPSLGGGLYHATPGAQAQLPVPRAGAADARAIAELARRRGGGDEAIEREIDERMFALCKLDRSEIDAIGERA